MHVVQTDQAKYLYIIQTVKAMYYTRKLHTVSGVDDKLVLL